MAWIGRLALLMLAYHARLSHQISSPEDPEYIAAVVEITPNYNAGNAAATIESNALKYVTHIETAKDHNVDIIVFPEDALTTIHFPGKSEMDAWTTLIPSPTDNYTPCDDDRVPVSNGLKLMSCAAKKNQMYVVFNIAEKIEGCNTEKCAEPDSIYYNTNVVMDRAGKIIARYRKTNLFGEPEFSVTDVPEIVTFDTDFGVKFGMFICFDILFYEPTLNLTRQHGIKDIVYSTAWFSEVPFLTAIQTQFGWAYAEDVNLLAAGYNNPATASTGTGIYQGRRGIAKAVFLREAKDQMLISRVRKFGATADDHETPNIPKEDENIAPQVKPQSLLHDDLSVYNSLTIDGPFNNEICQKNFCCAFKVNATNSDPATKYRAVVFNGRRKYGVRERVGIQVCGVVQCTDDTLQSCGSIESSTTTFHQIEITTTFHEYTDNIMFPSTLTTSILPFNDFTYDQYPHDDHVHITMALSRPTRDIVAFALYGRVMSEDHSLSPPIAQLS